MSPGSGHGDHVLPATGAPELRYKISHWRKMLILRTKQSIFAHPALQEIILAQPAVLIGLIAHIAGTLQEEIARTTDRLLRLGKDNLASSAARSPRHGRDRYETFCKIHDCH